MFRGWQNEDSLTNNAFLVFKENCNFHEKIERKFKREKNFQDFPKFSFYIFLYTLERFRENL